ncbi:MAG TPA: GNAT family N-acetyltransferase [Longimicrobium sp.]
MDTQHGGRPTDRELMRMHVETLFTHDAAGRLLRVNEPDGRRAPIFFLGRVVDGGRLLRTRHDVDDALAREIEAVCRAEPAGDEFLEPSWGSEPYEDLLARVERSYPVWSGPVYHFPRELPVAGNTMLVTEENAHVLSPHLEGWLDDVGPRQPMAVALAGGEAVSISGSVRAGAEAHEAGVETACAFRGRGHAAQAVAAWAAIVRAMGRIPLYSTSWCNEESQALARKLGLRRYGSTLHIT